VLLNDPDLIRHVLIDNAGELPEGQLCSSRSSRLRSGAALLTAEEESWRLQRRTVAPLFQPAGVTSYLAAMAISVDEMLARWDREDRRHGRFRARDDPADLRHPSRAPVFSNEIATPPDVMGEAITTYFEALGRIDIVGCAAAAALAAAPGVLKARPAQEDLRDEVLRPVRAPGVRASRRARASRTIW
jgi:hypothetical protein